MNGLTSGVLEYYETFLRIVETENLKVNFPPAEMRAIMAAASAMGGLDRILRTLNEEEVRLVRLAGAAEGLKVAEIRAKFGRLRGTLSGD
jgi:hypothetical protein